MFHADDQKVSRLCSSFGYYEPIIIIIKRNEEECDSTYICEEIYLTRQSFVTRFNNVDPAQSDCIVSIKIMIILLLSHVRRLTIKIIT